MVGDVIYKVYLCDVLDFVVWDVLCCDLVVED